MPFFQIIPPHSPTESKRLFYTSVSLLLSHIQGYCYHLSKFHIYALVYCIGFKCSNFKDVSRDKKKSLTHNPENCSSVQSLSRIWLFATPWTPGSMPGLPVHHQLLELTQTHVHWVGDAIQPSHPLSSPSPPALNLSQHYSLFKWVSSSHQVAKLLEFQLQHQSLQWTPRTDLL